MNSENQNIKQDEDFQQSRVHTESIPLPLGIQGSSYLALMSFLILIPCVGWLIPLILWLMGKDLSKQINQQGKYITNWYISWILYGIIIGGVFIIATVTALSKSITSPSPIPDADNIFPFFFISIFTDIIANFLIGPGGVFLILSIVSGLILFISPIIGGIKGLNGQTWKYPLSIPFLK
ncbi:DUF4870 domain-containing protein [Bacteroides sp.]|uniref:DUF4870 domain-containing protein n=1 Tax=Bacteroides sp. TaxID=29523 RepID=UPI00261877F6|nr:DUF4870 domain-containing protein [Bacteroides sp.]MDD3039196.1 DUF4870 domain-containing protein [Bacteroides sp.]